jgi:hypothetical protein
MAAKTAQERKVTREEMCKIVRFIPRRSGGSPAEAAFVPASPVKSSAS